MLQAEIAGSLRPAWSIIVSSNLAGAMKLDCLKKLENKARKKGREGREGGEREVSLTSLGSELSNW